MQFHDVTGRILEEGDVVMMPLAFGQAAMAPIVKIESGLGVQGADAQPKIYVSVLLPLAALPNGMVPGVVKVADKPQQQDAAPAAPAAPPTEKPGLSLV